MYNWKYLNLFTKPIKNILSDRTLTIYIDKWSHFAWVLILLNQYGLNTLLCLEQYSKAINSIYLILLRLKIKSFILNNTI